MRLATVFLLIGSAGLAQSTPGRFALLVGVTAYPNLPESAHLKGSANDVFLMRTLLTRQFSFPAENIVTLTEQTDSDQLPTRANIAREFRRLAERTKAGDQVVILLAGHGSQQPEKPGSPNPEPDGLDEIFLPRDAAPYERTARGVPNAITDDELGQWLTNIRAKQAFVWVILDSCHSGTMIRGANETARQVHPETDLGIPAEALRTAQLSALGRPGAERTRGMPAAHRNGLADSGLVALYACQANEVTVEQDLPRNGADAKPYGLFTYSICELVTRAAQPGGTMLTYRELVQRVYAHYSRLGRTAPTPQIEGRKEDRDRDILGQATWSKPSRIVLRTKGDKWKISAGALHGLNAGSILAVLSPKGDKAIGHVRIVSLNTFDAEVAPCAFQKVAANTQLPDDSPCTVVQLDYGSFKLKIGVESQALLDTLHKLCADFTLLEPSTDFRAADWLIRADAGKLFLVPASEWRSTSAPSFGPYEMHDLARLNDAFSRIVRARTLKKLAAGTDDIARAPGSSRAGLEIEVLRLKHDRDRGGTPVPLDTDSLAFHAGDLVTLVLTNNHRFLVDVTVLYINTRHGIDPWFPDEEVNRLRPGERYQIPPVRITAKTVGLENVVIMAVRARSKTPLDFTCFAQATIEDVRNKVKSAEAMKSPLGDLLVSGMFGHGDTRSQRSADIQDYEIKMLPWKVLPGKRPEGAKE